MTAEALARLEAKNEFRHATIRSRGLKADPDNDRAERHAAALLADRGIDVSTHRARQLMEGDLDWAKLVLTATLAHKVEIIQLHPKFAAKTFTMSEYATGHTLDVADAFEHPIAAYEAMVNQIGALIPAILRRAARFD
jgi:protein-tyrosine phosphatase